MISIALVNYSMLCLSPLPSQFTPPLTDHITHRCIWWRMSTTCLLSGVPGSNVSWGPWRGLSARVGPTIHGHVCSWLGTRRSGQLPGFIREFVSFCSERSQKILRCAHAFRTTCVAIQFVRKRSTWPMRFVVTHMQCRYRT
jgi:hypothetical protein